MPQVDVSCIVPVKNGEAFLQECLDSLLLQNFDLTFEVCIFDDGSTDSTPQIIEQNAPLFQSRNILFFSQRAVVSGGEIFLIFILMCYPPNIFKVVFCASVMPMTSVCPTGFVNKSIYVYNPQAGQLHCGCSIQPSSCKRHYQIYQMGMFSRTNQLKTQVYTSFGPTLIAPTCGFPEDLDFFYRALRLNVDLIKLEEVAIIYRHHTIAH
uniref:Glycosyltransferase 2-like domain-containing protein n=1 Tax=Ditylenchus dipsaci TaxID=166011 RepID=A0A915E377_9BILA